MRLPRSSDTGRAVSSVVPLTPPPPLSRVDADSPLGLCWEGRRASAASAAL